MIDQLWPLNGCCMRTPGIKKHFGLLLDIVFYTSFHSLLLCFVILIVCFTAEIQQFELI